MRRGLRWERQFLKSYFWEGTLRKNGEGMTYSGRVGGVEEQLCKEIFIEYKSYSLLVEINRLHKMLLNTTFEFQLTLVGIWYSFSVMRTRLLFLCSESPVYLLRSDLQFLKCWFGMELFQNIFTWFKNQVNYVILLDSFLWHFDFANLFQAVSV